MNKRKNTFLLILALLATGGLMLTSCSRHSSQTAMAQAQKYHCPMHPTYVSDKPGDCPICGMRLVPIKSEQESALPVPGQATVNIDANQQQRIGVAVSPVEKRDLTTAIRASARVAYDPNLYNAIFEYQQALVAVTPSEKTNGSLNKESVALVRASELRLRQMGLTDAQIKEAAKPGFDPSNLLLAREGERVWVYIDIYDFEAPLVKPGQKADLTSSASPGKKYPATIRAIDAVVNSETRTLRARAEAVNPDGTLRPEMYLNAVIHIPAGRKPAIPATAVIDTGVRQLVYVETSPGQYEPREVTLGKKAENYYEVLGGVKEGENVVTAANFLIDSESKLKAAIQGK